MKTKIIALFAILALAFVGLNTTSCSKDDDDSSSSTSDSAYCSKDDNDSIEAAADSFSSGKTDGTIFADTYAMRGAAFGIDFILEEYGAKYRNSNDKAYKAGFVAAATGATGLTESQLIALLESLWESE